MIGVPSEGEYIFSAGHLYALALYPAYAHSGCDTYATGADPPSAASRILASQGHGVRWFDSLAAAHEQEQDHL